MTDLDEYKARVREEAIRVAQQNGWCDSGLNDVLRRLDLPEKRTFSVPVTVTVSSTNTYHVLVNDAMSEAEAFDRMRSDREYGERIIRSQIGARGLASWEVPEPPKQPEAGSGVPVLGDPTPDVGDWYAVREVEGGPNQCRVVDPQGRVYCTRPVGHDVDWHVAAGANVGVLATWEAKEGDVRPFPAPRLDIEDDDEDEDDD